MTLWHASTELLTTATVVSKALYLVAALETESGRGLELGMASAELDTSG